MKASGSEASFEDARKLKISVFGKPTITLGSGEVPNLSNQRARDDHNSVIEEIDFECLSIAGALDKAKAMVKAGHADLYEDGMPICSMELVAETGVWLVGKPR